VRIPLSVLDLAPIAKGESVGASIAASVALAQQAERHGYRRVWYAEHHNMSRIASSATSVLIAHVAAHTSTIRLGAGGVMLPNHSPLTIAEQFGTLAEMHPDRIDLGLGRAPGSDQATAHAMRRDPAASERFPQDVQELRAYLGEESLVPGVSAVPGRGTHVPLYVLGSSLFGARLAAALGLPYAFASHFAPRALEEAVAVYRREFTPSDQLDQPYVIAAVNVIAAETDDEARAALLTARRAMAVGLFARGQDLSDTEADLLLRRGAAHHVDEMFTYAAVGDGAEVARYLERFRDHVDADELITAHQAPSTRARLASVALTAAAMSPVAAPTP